MATASITLGVQSGDVASSQATEPFFTALRRLLAAICIGPYSDEIDEFAIVLRIAGEIWNFEGEGCQKLRLNRKGRYVTIDIVLPQERWRGSGPIQLKEYLASSTEEALSLMIARLENSKIKVESTKLRSDAKRAICEFLK